VVEALHTGGAAMPWEMVEAWLCRDVYHCPPDALDRQDPARVFAHLEALDGEAVARKLNSGSPGNALRRRKAF
jgi:hypothetical protein